ncbi:hypothetical protein GCM10023115_16120 [Pontixanthobacter gangjinensis]|uniref:Lipoprotein n=1 Tax=Pontixanthobacter gangjinensis TaxID=1028742 RepID=A0A6I4SM66_9SPHN|nr:hypothetical protein [Pontixanthobacter gangjinensis]MXO56855.1 hypothetical protein [Pontixanthobacter gangjinensis]
MSARFLALPSSVVLLASCSADVDQPQAEAGAETIECALGESGDFSATCQVERATADGLNLLVVRHPDGGFRRFEQLTDGRGLAEADGAEILVRSLQGDLLEVAIGPDRYRFKAQKQNADAASE